MKNEFRRKLAEYTCRVGGKRLRLETTGAQAKIWWTIRCFATCLYIGDH